MVKKPKYSVSLSFEEVKLPPFQDILLLGRKCPHGKVGVSRCLNLLAPEAFEMVEINDPTVEAMLISKRLLKRMPAENIVDILKKKVFPYITPGELVRIDFNVKIYFDNIQGTFKKKI